MTMKHPWEAYLPLRGRAEPRPFARPEPADLDAYEADHHFPLPRSYRDFSLVYGLGSLCTGGDDDPVSQEYHLAIPGCHGRMPDCDPHDMTRWLVDTAGAGRAEDYAKRFGDGARPVRLVLFCFHTDCGFFGWDPDEVTDPEAHEYAIYFLPNRGRKLDRIADTFAGLVLDFMCQGELDPDDPTTRLLAPDADADEPEDEDEDEQPSFGDYFYSFVSSRRPEPGN